MSGPKCATNQIRNMPFNLLDWMGHMLFIATALNWLLVFALLLSLEKDYVCEQVVVIKFAEIIITGSILVLAISWFLKRLKNNSLRIAKPAIYREQLICIGR